jgi:hypothetical protein
MSVSQRVVRSVLGVAALGLVALTVAAAPQPIVVAAVVVVVLIGYAVVRPESSIVTVLFVLLVLHWLASVPVPGTLGGWLVLLLAGWLGLVVHLSASLAATLPGSAPIPAVSVRRWVARGAVVSGLMVPVWAAATISGLQSVPGEVGLTYAAIAAVALLALVVWLLSREPSGQA